MKNIIRKSILAFALTVTCYAQAEQPQLIVVPTAPGGSVDTLARKFAQFIELKNNKSVIIENKSGAGGAIGTTSFLKSRQNTLMITSGSWFVSINDGSFRLEDFRPIAILAESPFYLITNPTQNLTCEKLQSSTSRYFLGTATMSQTEMVGRAIIQKYPNIENVPYRAVKPATMDLLGNHINLAIVGGLESASHLVILANSTSRKVKGVPSFAECLKLPAAGVTADFILVAHKNSDAVFLKDMDLLVSEFIRSLEAQEYYQQAGLNNPNIGLKTIESKVLEKLEQWQKLTR